MVICVYSVVTSCATNLDVTSTDASHHCFRRRPVAADGHVGGIKAPRRESAFNAMVIDIWQRSMHPVRSIDEGENTLLPVRSFDRSIITSLDHRLKRGTINTDFGTDALFLRHLR